MYSLGSCMVTLIVPIKDQGTEMSIILSQNISLAYIIGHFTSFLTSARICIVNTLNHTYCAPGIYQIAWNKGVVTLSLVR